MKRQERALLVTFGRCLNRVISPLLDELGGEVTVFPLVHPKFASTCNTLQPSTSCEECLRYMHTFFFMVSYLCGTRDAGIALTAFLSDIVLQPKRSSVVVNVLAETNSYRPSILELGSGCGIVGLEVAQICSQCHVMLTDLPDAMEILSYNVSKVTGSNPAVGNVVTAVLDWDDANPKIVYGHQYDLVVVSDCTYNADSIPALVRTLAAVIDKLPAALIVVSMKVRHDSEAVFFDLMAAAGLIIAEHSAITLPDQQRADSGQDLEVVDIYIFGSN